MYACTSNRFYRSIDGGEIFQHITQIDNLDPNLNPSRTAIAISPASPHMVYVVMAWNVDPNGGENGHREVYISYDYGQHFNLMSKANDLGTQSSVNLAIEVDPNNSANVIMGGVPILKSQSFGVTFTETGTQGPFYEVHADIHDIIFQGGNLYLATDGGVSRSSDLGNTWVDASFGLAITQFYDIDVFNNKFLGGTQDNGTLQWTIGDASSTRPLGADGFESYFDRHNSSIFYASTQSTRHRFPGSVNITPADQNSHWDASWAFHPTRSDTSYACRDLLSRTYNKGASWQQFDVGLPSNNNIRAIAQGINNPNFLYVSDRSHIALTQNIHATNPAWTIITSPFNLPNDARYWKKNVGSISVNPENAFRVWVTMWGYEEGEKVYFSANAGQFNSWQNISGSLPNVPIRASVAAPGPNEGIYVGTDIGVFYRDNTLSDWIWFSNGLPKSRIEDMIIMDGYLYVGTYGRGAWRSLLYNPCPANYTLLQNFSPDPNGISGTYEYDAAITISSNLSVYGGPGTNVTFRAGNAVTLTDGFTVNPLSTFEAKIDGCE